MPLSNPRQGTLEKTRSLSLVSSGGTWHGWGHAGRWLGGGLAYTELGFCLDWDRGGIPRVLQNHSIGKFKIEE